MQFTAFLVGQAVRPFRPLMAVGPAALVLAMRAAITASGAVLDGPSLAPGTGMCRTLCNRETRNQQKQRQPELTA